MTGTKIRQYLPVMADIFAQYAAVAALLWFDPPFDVTEVEARCQRAMRGALESKEVALARLSSACNACWSWSPWIMKPRYCVGSFDQA